MSRGPLPWQAIDNAIEIAQLRGIVQEAGHRPEYLYDFTIVSTVPVVFVAVKYSLRILAPVTELAWDFRQVIHPLQSIIRDNAVSRELWLRSRHGSWRFFRITDSGLIELDRHGNLLGEKICDGGEVIPEGGFPVSPSSEDIRFQG
ncbi:MAG: hypothetical protein WC586_02410 [Methanoregula sp.]